MLSPGSHGCQHMPVDHPGSPAIQVAPRKPRLGVPALISAQGALESYGVLRIDARLDGTLAAFTGGEERKAGRCSVETHGWDLAEWKAKRQQSDELLNLYRCCPFRHSSAMKTG